MDALVDPGLTVDQAVATALPHIQTGHAHPHFAKLAVTGNGDAVFGMQRENLADIGACIEEMMTGLPAAAADPVGAMEANVHRQA